MIRHLFSFSYLKMTTNPVGPPIPIPPLTAWVLEGCVKVAIAFLAIPVLIPRADLTINYLRYLCGLGRCYYLKLPRSELYQV